MKINITRIQGAFVQSRRLSRRWPSSALHSVIHTFHVFKKLFERAVRRPAGLLGAGAPLSPGLINTLRFH